MFSPLKKSKSVSATVDITGIFPYVEDAISGESVLVARELAATDSKIWWHTGKLWLAALITASLTGSPSSYFMLWLPGPDHDAPRYIPGFSVTTIWMGAMRIIALIERCYFNKHPIEAPEAEEVIAAEISRQREKGQISTNMKV